MIVINPAVSAEVSAAGLALYREHRGDQPDPAFLVAPDQAVTACTPRGKADRTVLAIWGKG